ncbi:hypothetical protein OG455_33405 [Kitasatospora sp. NBC_01287]|uniref:hypothetical protein n=1 Tax=Kitasatospora sp. NBC_01287 TaxID=2903573 RepID=UPI002258A534|nr:hypothetical protein [Kitasatospora sp. NBC_01287]MCX4750352.1 hypothetical protein [Kitasatospora sp. NBC_01287]
MIRARHRGAGADSDAPRARRDGLRVKELADGRLALYDERAERGHLLSPLCATVHRLADGTRGLTALTSAVAAVHPSADAAVVRLALTELGTAGLVGDAGYRAT